MPQPIAGKQNCRELEMGQASARKPSSKNQSKALVLMISGEWVRKKILHLAKKILHLARSKQREEKSEDLKINVYAHFFKIFLVLDRVMQVS